MSCDISTTLVSALAVVAANLGCRVEIVKVLRCSTPLASMADALSKADFARFRDLSRAAGLSLPLEPLMVPRELSLWLQDPRPDWELGHRLLRGISKRGGAVLDF